MGTSPSTLQEIAALKTKTTWESIADPVADCGECGPSGILRRRRRCGTRQTGMGVKFSRIRAADREAIRNFVGRKLLAGIAVPIRKG